VSRAFPEYVANERVFFPLAAGEQLGVACPSSTTDNTASAAGYFAPAI
jgi:hypothetical protein